MSNAIVTKQMMDVIDAAKKTLREAKRDFEKAHREIRNMSYQRIDLFGGKAVSQVADIVSATKMASEAKYVACQTLVAGVDEMCRPLLSQDPDLSAVEAVGEFIKELNVESKIENNFNASLNGGSTSDLANIRYSPSLESQMIERFWAEKYKSWPGRKEKEMEEENRFREVEKRVAEENAQALEKYNADCLIWKNECEKIDQELNVKLDDSCKTFKNRYIENCKKLSEKKAIYLLAKKKEVEKDIDAKTQELRALGIFAFGKKRKLSSDIKTRQKYLESLDGEILSEESGVKIDIEKADAVTEEFRKKEYERISKAVYPLEPQKPTTKQVLKRIKNTYNYADPLKNDILYELGDMEKTISEIMEGSDLRDRASNQKIARELRELIAAGAVVKYERDRRTYFRLAEQIKWTDGYVIMTVD